ncbi:hypothetical protein BS78_06G229100 [Paspalum vaginatum]|nr:hypothetical protein BS78_06G229100 [Paspalum vaginatum]
MRPCPTVHRGRINVGRSLLFRSPSPASPPDHISHSDSQPIQKIERPGSSSCSCLHGSALSLLLLILLVIAAAEAQTAATTMTDPTEESFG